MGKDKKDDEEKARRKELMRTMTAEIDKSGLTPGQRLFCLYYAQSHNALQSYLKAYSCTAAAAGVSGHRLLKNAKVRKEIRRLRKILADSYFVDEGELIRFLLGVIGANISDYLEFHAETVGGYPQT